jgi:hypothetical protein
MLFQSRSLATAVSLALSKYATVLKALDLSVITEFRVDIATICRGLTRSMVVPLLRRLVSRFQSRQPGFDYRSGHVGFVFYLSISLPLTILIPPTFHIPYHRRFIAPHWQRRYVTSQPKSKYESTQVMCSVTDEWAVSYFNVPCLFYGMLIILWHGSWKTRIV